MEAKKKVTKASIARSKTAEIERKRLTLYLFLTQNHKNGRLVKGALSRAAEASGYTREGVRTFWKTHRSNILDPDATSIDVRTKPGRGFKSKYDAADLAHRINSLPVEQRSTLRSLAASIDVPLTSLRRVYKKGDVDATIIRGNMKAIVVESTGGVEALKLRPRVATPSVDPGHVLVKNEYAGLNFIDTYHRTGLYHRELPFVLGSEGGGTVAGFTQDEQTSDDVAKSGLQVGDRVVYAFPGSYAEFTSVPVEKLVPVPADLDMKTAIACMTQGLTAHYLASSVGAGITRPGDWLLIYSVGSGTCQWAAQMAKLKGYRVIGTTSHYKTRPYSRTHNDAQLAARFGCDRLIVLKNAPGKCYADYTSLDIVDEVMKFTGGAGCKMIIDGVGKSTYEISLQCLSKRGLFVSFGNASGAVPAFPVLKLVGKSAYVTRPKLSEYIETREELLQRAEEIFRWVKEGKLKVMVDTVFSLEEAAKGHEYLENGQGRGKILFQVS